MALKATDIQECIPNTPEKGDRTSDQQEVEQNHETGLTFKQKFCFSVGHIQNDLQAYAATSYLLLFLSKVIGLQNDSTAIIFLVAQVADGILSPVLGFFCDRYQFPWLARFGKRKAWHIFGVIVLLIFSPFLFLRCLPCEQTSERRHERVAIVWYSVIVITIHVGFATVQISHLALLPDIAKKQGDHVKLNSLRSAWTFISGMFVYGVFWFLLGQSSDQKLSGKDKQEFWILGVIIVAVGFAFTVVFYAGVNENEIKREQESRPIHGSASNPGYEEDGNCNQTNGEASIESNEHIPNGEASIESNEHIPNGEASIESNGHIPNGLALQMNPQIPVTNNRQELRRDDGMKTKVKRWFKTKQFYMVGIVYMCSRVVVNVSNAYFPFYLQEALGFEKNAIAYFPLVVLVASAIFSWVAKKVGSYWNNHVAHCIAAVMAIGAYIWLHFQPISSRNIVYGASVLMGAGSSMMLVTALTMAAVMIDSVDKTTGAFVFGFMSLTDKVANGVIISIVQALYPTEENFRGICSECASYIRLVFPLVTGCAALLSLLVVMVMIVKERNDTKHNHENLKQNGVAINSSYNDDIISHEDSHDTKL